MEKERVEIKRSKTKSVLSFLGCTAFVVVSTWLIIYGDQYERLNVWIPRIVGSMGLIFFGVCGAFIFKKFFDDKPGLVVDRDGILDNSSAVSGQLIPWDMIKGIRKTNFLGTGFVLIDLDNPQNFINEAKSNVTKRLMWGNYKTTGTPTSLSSVALTCSFDELYDLINDRLKSRTQKS
jgi:amino acid permease